MSRKHRRKVIAYALETTYGVDAISAGTPKYLLGREFSITPMAGESKSLDYDDGTLGNSAEIVTELYVTVEFTVDLAAANAATTPAPWGDLMKACLRGVAVGASDVTYGIDENSTDSLTLYYYQSGTLHKITGARGSLSMTAPAKEFGSIKFTFSGLHAPAETQALPAADFTAWQKPLKIGAANSSFTIDSNPIKLISLEYDQANQVPYQEYVGHEEVLITDFQPTATMVIEAPALTELDVFALAQAGSEHALEFTNGPVGNQVVWKSSQVQLGRPTYADQDGTQTYSIPLRVISNSDQFITR